MDSFIFLGYELLSAFAPFLIVFMLFRTTQKRNGISFSRYRFIATLAFFVYIAGVYHFTGAGTIYDWMRFRLEINQSQINFIPFSHDIDIVGYLLNILLFIPLGLLVPIIWEKMNKLTNIISIGFFFTLLIEISQLLNNRSTDIDDILLNIWGAVLGYGFFKLWDKFTESKYQINHSVTLELPIYIVTIYLGRFLLFNEIGLAKFLYGF